MSSSQMNDSTDLIDIRLANRSKMLPQQKRQTQASTNSGKTSAASNYAQQLHGDMISQVLAAPSTLPPVPDSPSLQHQNMPKKQPVKSKIVSQKSRHGSASSFNHSNMENMNSRNSSCSGTHAKRTQSKNLRASEDFSAREVRQQKSRHSQAAAQSTADLNNGSGSRRQSSKSRQNLPPTHGGSKRANSRHRVRTSTHHQSGFDEYSFDGQSERRSKNGGGPLPPRKPTQTSSARSLQPLKGQNNNQAQQPPTNGHTLNPNQVVPTPPSHLSMQSSKHDEELMDDYAKRREIYMKLQEEKDRMEMELRQNQNIMEEKVVALAEERRNVQILIVKAAITIQRFARGFITRLKVQKVYRLQMEFEKARLDDALSQMQAMIAQQAKNVPPTPIKEEPEDFLTSAKAKKRRTYLHDSAIPEALEPGNSHRTEKGEKVLRMESPPLQQMTSLQPDESKALDAHEDAFRANTEHATPSQKMAETEDLKKVLDEETKTKPRAQIDLQNTGNSSYAPIEPSVKSNKSALQTEVKKVDQLVDDSPPENNKEKKAVAVLTDKRQKEAESMVGAGVGDRGLLDQLENAQSDDVDIDLDDSRYTKAAVVIQRQARVMIARNNFRVALYKLILLKNIVETKMHKERMQVLYAFEQLIINTEDADGMDAEDSNATEDDCTRFIQQTGLTREQIEEVLANEADPYLRQQLEDLYNPLVFKGVNEAEQYFENTEDIINEEDLEESVCESRKQSPIKASEKVAEAAGQSYKDLLAQTEMLIAQASARQSQQQSSQNVSKVTDSVLEESKAETDKSAALEAVNTSRASSQFSKQLVEKLQGEIGQQKADKATEEKKIHTPMTKQSSLTSQQKSAASVRKDQAQGVANQNNRPPVNSKPAWRPSAAAIERSKEKQNDAAKPLQERTMSSANSQSKSGLRQSSAASSNGQTRQSTTNLRQAHSSARLSQNTTSSRDQQQSSEQGKQSTSLARRTSTLSSKTAVPDPAQKKAETASKAPQPRIKQDVTKKDILEFSGQPTEELQQSGQINFMTGLGGASQPSNAQSRAQSDSGSQNGNKPRVPRDNSIIERNKAKLAALAEKKLQQKRDKQDKELKEKEAKDAAARPPRPFDATRLESLSQPKPKADDPNFRKEQPKLKRVSNQTRRQLQERAARVKNRQNEAVDKAVKTRLLAITDGQSQGSNIVLVNDDKPPQDPNAEKRRSNILKSRELKRRPSANDARSGSRGRQRDSVFERLSQAAQKNQNADKGSQRRSNLMTNQSQTQVRLSLEGNYGANEQSNQLLAIEPAYDMEPAKPTSDVRRSYDIVVQKGGYGAHQIGAQAHVQVKNHIQQPLTAKNGGTQSGYMDRMTDNDEGMAPPRQSHNPGAFTMKNLRQAQAQAINDDSGDEIDEMPFVSKGARGRPSVKRQTPSVQMSTGGPSTNEYRQLLEPLAYPNKDLSSSNSTLKIASNQTSVHIPQQTTTVVAKPDLDKDRDWLLDPVNLYMRGMAQRREQMKQLQSQIGQEQRAEINRRIANFKMN